MNDYQTMWGELGYGRCYARVMATQASLERKQAALSRAWNRKRRLHFGDNGLMGRQMLVRHLMCNP